MDPPDSTEPNLSLSDLNDSEIFGLRPNMQYDMNDDFLQDLFILSNEHKESVVADQLENGNLEYDHKMKSCPENPDSDVNLELPAPNILEKDPSFHSPTMMEKLKQQIKELKEKSLKQECELAEYEEKLSEKMNDLLKVQMERDSLKENLRLTDDERASLKLKIEEKEAELKQFKSLIEKQGTKEGIQALKKQMLNETKLLKKAEKDLQHNTELLSKSKESLKLLRKRNKKLVATIIEFGDILEHKELLPVKRKKYLETVRKKFKVEDENCIDDSASEGENVENNSLDEASNLRGKHVPAFNGILFKKGETLYSNGLPVDSDSNSAACINGFLHEVKSSPHSVLEEKISVDPSKSHKYISSFVKESVVAPISPVMCKTQEIINDVANELFSLKTNHLSPDSNFQSFASGTDSLCSEDMEITDECFAKIKKGIEGWVLKSENYAPLSPLPPSPPPKSNSENRIPSSGLVTKTDNTDNSDKLTPLSSVSTSVESLSECTEKTIICDKTSSFLIEESDSTESSEQAIPFSIVPCFDQQVTPSDKISYECLKKENILSPQNFSAVETESEVTESTPKVAKNSEPNLNQQVTPISPESSVYIEKETVHLSQTSSNLYSEKIKDSDHFIPFCNATNQSSFQVLPELSSSACIQKKNILSHQNSKGFEPHIERNLEKSVLNNSTVSESFVSPPVIPPELHYLSSSYDENDSFKILHQGHSVYDYLVNPETKLSVCVLTLTPKMSSLGSERAFSPNSAVKNTNVLSQENERIKRVLSLYQATEKRVTLVKDQIIDAGSSHYSNNPTGEKLPHVCVVVESENDVSVTTVENACSAENASDSGMDLDCTTFDDIQKDNAADIKGQSDENQSLVSSSCDVSKPSKRKLTSSSFNCHGSIQSQLANKKCTKSHVPPVELHQEDEIKLNVPETIKGRKRATEYTEDLSCKKVKIGAQLINVTDKEKIIVPPDGNVSLSKINQPSKKSPSNLKCLLSEGQFSHTDCPQLENKNSPLKNEVLPNAHGTELSPHGTSPSKHSLLFTINNSKIEFENSSEKELFSKVRSPFLGSDESTKNQLSSEVSSLQLKLISPLKSKHISTVSCPEKVQKHPQLNLVSTLGANNSQLILKNSEEKCQPSSEVDSHLLQCKSSPLKNHTSNANSPKQDQQNSELNCVSALDVNNPELNIKKSDEKCLPSPDVNSHLLQCKNSPLKNYVSASNNPKQKQQNSDLNCVSALDVNSSPLKPESSPEKCHSLSKINSHLLQCENSLLKNQLISNVSSPEKLQQNSQLNYISTLDIASSPLKPKSSPKKCQPLSDSNSHLLNCKNSTLKNQHVPNVRSPEKFQQNSQINCVPALDVNSSLKFKNSHEGCQPLSEVNNHLFECKNSFKNQPLLNIPSLHLELGISPSENQLSSDLSSAEQSSKNQALTESDSPTLELKNSPLELQCLSNVYNPISEAKKSPTKFHPVPDVNSLPFEIKNSPLHNKDSIRSPDLYFEENSLVIDVPEESELQINNSDCLTVEGVNESIDIGNECSVTTHETNHKTKNKKNQCSRNKKKNCKASAKSKKKNSKPSIEEEVVNIIISIPKVLEQIEEVQIHDSLSESHFKRYAHTLLSAIINPSNASSTASVIYQICNRLRFSRTNPLISFPIEYNISVFFPLTERCIVSALVQAEQKKKNHLEGLVATAINNLYLLVLSKESISKTGLGAFCRVFAELCKNTKNRKKPIRLCCELIKRKHKFAPVLIASIIGVWPELFSVTDETPDVEVMIQGSIAYGLEKKPPSLTSADWKQCKAVFSKYLNSPPVSDVDEATKNLIEILEEFLEETSSEDDYMMTDPLLMFAACNGWEWAEKNLSSNFILPSIARYAQQKNDERSFSLFCNLYADISLLSPNFESCSEIFEQLFLLKEAFHYVKGCAARSMIKLYLLSKHKFPSYLYDWTQENESQLIGTPTELLLKQRLISDVSSFSESDIIIL